jgi:hypothetical protein
MTDLADLGPTESSSYAWSAVGLKVAHPGRPHRLTVEVVSGDPSSLSVAVVEQESNGQRARLILDACASGPPILPAGGVVSSSWYLWPGLAEPSLILVNRSPHAPLKLGTVRLAEIETLPSAPFIYEPKSGPKRAIGLYLAGPHSLERFGGGGEPARFNTLAASENLADYLEYCGATDVVVSETLSDRADRRLLGGQAVEDSTSPDRLELLFMILRRHACHAWLEVDFESDAGLGDLPPADSREAFTRGLVRVDRTGQADGPTYHPLHRDVRSAMKARVAEAISKRRTEPALQGLLIRLGTGPTLLGTPDTGFDDATYERFIHETFGPELAKEIPGLGKTDPGRFEERLRYLTGIGRVPWLTWRSRAIASLYSELAQCVRESSPGAELAVATPTLDQGASGAEARRVDLAGLSPVQAWRSVGFDLQVWPDGPGAPIVVRASGLSTEDLAHDLATNSDLDARVVGRSRRGMMFVLDEDRDPVAALSDLSLPPIPREAPAEGAVTGGGPLSFPPPRGFRTGVGIDGAENLWMRSLPLGDGPEGDEPLGHALASFDAQWFLISSSIATGNEERLRRFAAVLRAIPARPAQPSPSPTSIEASRNGVALRITRADSRTYLAIANDTPYPIRLAALVDGVDTSTPVDDLGRGIRLALQASEEKDGAGRLLVVDLLPFGASAIRLGSPNGTIRSVTPYPSQLVLNGMEAHYKELSAQLARLNRSLSGGSVVELASPGFEPSPEPQIQRTTQRSPEDMPKRESGVSEIGSPPVGWKVEGEKGATALIDGANPHSGQGSVKLAVTAPPASLLSDPFTPNTLSALTIEAFLRSDSPDAKVRVWIEAQSEGKPFIRRSELVVSQDWKPRAFRAADVPQSGLDSARLRFEMMSVGNLWIDDVKVISEQASKSARLNAQRALLSALQAYREKRYADFARLGTSHWTKHPGVLASIRGSHPTSLSQSNPDVLPGPEPAAASALPPDRAVR